MKFGILIYSSQLIINILHNPHIKYDEIKRNSYFKSRIIIRSLDLLFGGCQVTTFLTRLMSKQSLSSEDLGRNEE